MCGWCYHITGSNLVIIISESKIRKSESNIQSCIRKWVNVSRLRQVDYNDYNLKILNKQCIYKHPVDESDD